MGGKEGERERDSEEREQRERGYRGERTSERMIWRRRIIERDRERERERK